MAKLVHLIETEELRGDGSEKKPYRRVKQWFTLDGNLVVESDAQYEPTPAGDWQAQFLPKARQDALDILEGKK